MFHVWCNAMCSSAGHPEGFSTAQCMYLSLYHSMCSALPPWLFLAAVVSLEKGIDTHRAHLSAGATEHWTVAPAHCRATSRAAPTERIQQ